MWVGGWFFFLLRSAHPRRFPRQVPPRGSEVLYKNVPLFTQREVSTHEIYTHEEMKNTK